MKEFENNQNIRPTLADLTEQKLRTFFIENAYTIGDVLPKEKVILVLIE